jgi:hypothetical protein
MKRATTFLAILAISLGASVSAKAAVHVRGYYRSNGTYVQPHYRSNPDGNFWNNWSTYPNVNPYTGAVGTKRTPPSSTLPSYRAPSQSQSTYLYTNPYTGVSGTRRSTSDLGSLSYRTPTYNWNTPNLWNSRSPSAPSLSQSSRDSLGRSLWKK